MSKLLKITLVQYDIAWENPNANKKKIEALLSTADLEETDIIVLPETFSTGFTMNNVTCSESMEGETINWLKSMAKSYETSLCGSLIIKENGKIFNRFVFVNHDDKQFTYDKRYLFSLANEDKYYEYGKEKVIIPLKTRKGKWNVCPLICYDLRFPEWSRNRENIDLYIYVANFPARRTYAWEQLLIARAIENQAYVVGVNRTGKDEMGLEYAGNSMVVDYKGMIMANCYENEQILSIDLDLKSKSNYIKDYPFLKDQFF